MGGTGACIPKIEKVLEKQKRDAERREEAFKRLHEWNKKMKERRDKWQKDLSDPSTK